MQPPAHRGDCSAGRVGIDHLGKELSFRPIDTHTSRLERNVVDLGEGGNLAAKFEVDRTFGLSRHVDGSHSKSHSKSRHVDGIIAGDGLGNSTIESARASVRTSDAQNGCNRASESVRAVGASESEKANNAGVAHAGVEELAEGRNEGIIDGTLADPSNGSSGRSDGEALAVAAGILAATINSMGAERDVRPWTGVDPK